MVHRARLPAAAYQHPGDRGSLVRGAGDPRAGLLPALTRRRLGMAPTTSAPPFHYSRRTQAMTTNVHLVGSVGLDTAEEVFEAAGKLLGPYLKRVPDGEVG